METHEKIEVDLTDADYDEFMIGLSLNRIKEPTHPERLHLSENLRRKKQPVNPLSLITHGKETV